MAGMHSNTPPGKNCPTNIGPSETDIRNIRPVFEEESKYSDSLGEPGKQNTVINHNKIKKKHTASARQNPAKVKNKIKI